MSLAAGLPHDPCRQTPGNWVDGFGQHVLIAQILPELPRTLHSRSLAQAVKVEQTALPPQKPLVPLEDEKQKQLVLLLQFVKPPQV